MARHIARRMASCMPLLPPAVCGPRPPVRRQHLAQVLRPENSACVRVDALRVGGKHLVASLPDKREALQPGWQLA